MAYDLDDVIHDTEVYRDSIATVDAKGKRVWIYPKKPSGKFFNARTLVSIVLLIVLFGLPFLKVNGEQFILLNIIERKFVLFGFLFTPQDFHILGIAMILFMVFIIVFTVIFGRLFCGWVCPQTIFMEMVFRKIEYWIEGDAVQQRKLNAAPWDAQKVFKKGLKVILFFIISVLIANTFLSYIIGSDNVMKIITEPIALHKGGFIAMLIFSGVFFFVFMYMREQVCIAICPYGRLQGVLIDKNTMVIAYDHVRGEPRGKLKKQGSSSKDSFMELPVVNAQVAPVKTQGDCIDCKLCVQVCPTGIDIRHGTQLECVNCTACIDACDAVMEKIQKPTGLVRYASAVGIESGTRQKLFNTRVKAYSFVLILLLGIESFLLMSRASVEAVILRTPGMLFQEVDATHISNLYNYQLINKTNLAYPVVFQVDRANVEVKLIGNLNPEVKPSAQTKGEFFLILDKSQIKERKTTFKIKVLNKQTNEVLDEVKTSFYAPQ